MDGKLKRDDAAKYDILVIEQNNMPVSPDNLTTLPNYDARMRLNRSQNLSIGGCSKQKSYADRYKPIIHKDYTKTEVDIPLPLKAGGLGPNIGGKEWIEEKLKRSRIKDFSAKLDHFKNNSSLLKRKL